MTKKPKTPQKADKDHVSGRDLFQTPTYATNLLIPFIPRQVETVWECACGENKITYALRDAGYTVVGTDLRYGLNFLQMDKMPPCDAIVTNPPFSLKRKFYEHCRKFKVPFALLIPADYSGWIIKALQSGAQKIIPTRRIDYITPTGKSGATGQTSYYHSMWLTWGFGLKRTETFVELTKEMKADI